MMNPKPLRALPLRPPVHRLKSKTAVELLPLDVTVSKTDYVTGKGSETGIGNPTDMPRRSTVIVIEPDPESRFGSSTIRPSFFFSFRTLLFYTIWGPAGKKNPFALPEIGVFAFCFFCSIHGIDQRKREKTKNQHEASALYPVRIF